MYLDPERVKALLGKTTTPTTTGSGLLSAPETAATVAPGYGSQWMGLDSNNPFLLYQDAAKYLARDLGYTGPVMDQTAAQAQQAARDAWTPSFESFSAESTGGYPAAALDKAFSDFIASKGYTFAPSMQGREPATSVYDSTGKQVGQYRTGDADSRMMQVAQVAIPAVVGAGFGGGLAALGGATGATAGAVTGATSGAVSSGASGGNVLQGALLGGLLGGVGGYAKDAFGAAAGSAGGDVAAMGADQVGALSTPIDMSGFIQPSQGQFAGMSLSELDAFRAALNASEGAAAGMASQPSTPTTYDQLRAAEKANVGQTTGNIPSTVNMGSLGGTTATTGGIGGALNVAGQSLADSTATSQLGGTTASSLGQTAGSALGNLGTGATDLGAWLKANPTLGRLLFSGATSALSSMGSGSSGSASSSGTSGTILGPAKSWTTPLQKGLLSPVTQYAPAAVQSNPRGLLAQGFQNDGAWRYMGG